MNILRTIWNGITTVKQAVTNLLFIVIVVFIVVTLSNVETVNVPDEGILQLHPTGTLVLQRQSTSPFNQIVYGSGSGAETSLAELTEALDRAREDRRIKGVVLNLNDFTGGAPALLSELGSAIDRFRDGDKPVVAFGSSFSQSQYFIAAHAESIYLHNDSVDLFTGVLMSGYGVYPTYFKSAMDRFKVRYHVFRAGDLKSAVEPYLRDSMSTETRQVNLSWLGSLWDEYATTISDSRGLEKVAFTRYTQQYARLLAEYGGDGGELALSYGLVDELISPIEFDQRLERRFDMPGNLQFIDHRDYLTATELTASLENSGTRKVAVIAASGVILAGHQPPGTIGADSLSQLLQQAQDDPDVGAVVLRIDSAGGSATAAEHIRQKVLQVQASGKPVVMSMSGYAASGGYWIAAPGNRIFAMPNTVTGSIGAYALLPSLSDALAEYGINTDGVGTTTLAGAMDPFRPLGADIKSVLELSLNRTYSRFVSVVGDGRNLSQTEVLALADGRVWTGNDAMSLGLIDSFGNLEDAVASAALLAGLNNYDVTRLQVTLTPGEQLMSRIINQSIAVCGRWCTVNDPLSWVQGAEEVRWLIQQQSVAARPAIYLQCLECRVQ